MRKLLKEEKSKGRSPSPERKMSLEMAKKNDIVDLRDLRTQFRDMVTETYAHQRNSQPEVSMSLHTERGRDFSPLSKNRKRSIDRKVPETANQSLLGRIHRRTESPEFHRSVSGSKPIYYSAKHRYAQV